MEDTAQFAGGLLDAPLSEPSALPGPVSSPLTESDSRPGPAAPTESVLGAASQASWGGADLNKGAEPRHGSFWWSLILN